MPSRNTALNCSERANFALNETVTPLSRSPLFDIPAIGQLPSTLSRRHTMPCGSHVVAFRQQRLNAVNRAKKRAARRRLRKLTGRRQTEWTGHSDPEDWMRQTLARES